MKRNKAMGVEIIIYQPAMDPAEIYHSEVSKELIDFKKCSDVIIANCSNAELEK